MNDFEFLQVTMQVTELCSSTEYRKAFQLSRRRGTEALAQADKDSEEHAAIRLLIGTWDRIAMFSESFSAKQRQQFFRSHPVSLVWNCFEPAIEVIRRSTDDRFAKTFENLHNQYEKWTTSKDGREFSTVQRQAIVALFFC
jgi:hypothetical protein